MSVSTPRKPTMSAHNTHLASPGRRVLGDVTSRAINTPSKQTNKARLLEEQQARSPLKQVHSYSPLSVTDKENVLGGDVFKSCGRKRSIEEVDGPEQVARGAATTMFAGVHDEEFLMTSKVRALAETSACVEVADRRGSRGSTTEAESPLEMEQPSQETTDSNRSFSNFVDWTECASQPTATAEEQQTTPEKKEPSKADLLRLRLGFATYKVRTNQISKPGSEILSTWDVEVETESPVSTSTIRPTTTVTAPCIPSITVSPARQHQPKLSSPLHVKADLNAGRPIAKLSGAPVLLPTTYSSRMIHDYHANVPSSPPAHDVLPKCVSPEQVMSPTRPIYRTPAMRRIREEDYCDGDDGEHEEMIQERARRQEDERRFGRGELTSSVVKGRAAMGLLELNSGRR